MSKPPDGVRDPAPPSFSTRGANMVSRGFIALMMSACGLLACDRNRASDDSTGAPVTNTNATVNAPPLGAADVSSAENAANIARYGDEVPFRANSERVVAKRATARTMPEGDIITIFAADDDVTAIAREGDWYLVLYSDPVEPRKRLAGWVHKDGFLGDSADLATPGAGMSCGAGEVFVLGDGVCARACTWDGDCSSPSQACNGKGAVTFGSGASHATYCVSRSGR
jgi:hypothetical protein